MSTLSSIKDRASFERIEQALPCSYLLWSSTFHGKLQAGPAEEDETNDVKFRLSIVRFYGVWSCI